MEGAHESTVSGFPGARCCGGWGRRSRCRSWTRWSGVRGRARQRRRLRMAFLYVPNGIVMDEWTPKGQAAGGRALPEELPRITRALGAYPQRLA